MNKLSYVTDYSKMVQNRKYLLIYVDGESNSNPSIDTGLETVKFLVGRLNLVDEEEEELISDLNDFKSIKTLLKFIEDNGNEYDLYFEQLNEMGYSVYEL
ncbi:MAG: hypothetical protein [Caudoviricetes sp.]|nr:MAG: hypothetical protein [Caudoviricetes sp.]